MERVNGVIADVLRALVNDRQDNWPELTPLARVEFAINDAASPLGSSYTPFYADRGQHPRRPLAPPDEAEAPEAVGGAAVPRSPGSWITSRGRCAACCRSVRMPARLALTLAVGTYVLRRGTRCCWTPPTRPFRPAASSRVAG